MVTANNSYDPVQSYKLLLASTLAYINYAGIPQDADGYINIGDAIVSGHLNLEAAIAAAHITVSKRGNGVRKMADYLAGEDLHEWSVKVIRDGLDQALVIKNNDQLIVSFRGTSLKNVKEWKRNFKFEKKPFLPAYERFLHGITMDGDPSPLIPSPKAWVHDGFLEAVNGDGKPGIGLEIEKEVQTQQRNRSQQDKQAAELYVTGHSLGAAMAMLYASQTTNPVTALYTYGQPRVGNEEFCKFAEGKLQGKYYRIVNKPDIVTDVPPPFVPDFPYRHIGEEISLHKGGLRELRRLGKDWLDPFVDHQPFLYAQALHTEMQPHMSFRDRVKSHFPSNHSIG